MSTIAHRLADVRAASGLGVRPFAERVSRAGYRVSYGAVSSYEREEGTEKIPAAYVAAVCEEFGVSPDWLLTGRGVRERLPGDGAADSYRMGMIRMASRVVEAIDDVLSEYAPQDARGEDDAIIREAANRLREIGAAARSVRRPEGSGPR